LGALGKAVEAIGDPLPNRPATTPDVMPPAEHEVAQTDSVKA
jgi:hypothetical protein